MARIVLNETSYHGAGSIHEIVGEVKGRGLHKALVCSDPDLVRFGVTKRVLDVLDGAGLAYELYSDIKPNPTIENVQTGVADRICGRSAFSPCWRSFTSCGGGCGSGPLPRF